MELIRGLHNLRPRHRGCVATIGNFDGVHLGHQAVFAALRKVVAGRNTPTTAITFEPQPLEFFAPAKAPARLTRLREKCMVMRKSGLDRALVLAFNAQLAALEAEAFVRQVLVDGLGVEYLLVGDDFRFGRQRLGDFALLVRLGRECGFEVHSLESQLHLGERISSTRIRELLVSGELEQAAELLGRPYSMFGRVGYGDRRGRELGFPTLNLGLHRHTSPLRGVFAVQVRGIDSAPLPGVANLGSRPTVDGMTPPRLEVHLFDFDRDVYGRHVEVEFIHFLRAERRFATLEELRQQIAKDTARARALLLPTAAVI